jgi:hypothetical protein
MSNFSKATIGMFLGLVYAAVFFFLAFLAIGGGGAGHGPGTLIFFAVVVPYGLGLLYFPLIGLLSAILHSFASKVLFVSTTVVHYALVLNALRMDHLADTDAFRGMWNYSPPVILIPTLLYVGAHVFIWLLFVRACKLSRTPPNKSLDASRGSVFLMKLL